MKPISTYIRAFFSLGALGMVIALLALAMLFATLSQESIPFDAAIERMTTLQALQAQIGLDLAEMQVRQVQEIFTLTYGMESSGAFGLAQQADERISQTLAELEEYDSFYEDEDAYISDLSEELANFEESLALNRQIFEFIVSEFDEMDDEEWSDALIELEENQEILNWQLSTLTIVVEQDRQRALADFPDDADTNILIIVTGLAFTLLLALTGYQIIAVTVHPLRHLRNTITTIGGDVYRPGSNLPKGTAGRLAKTLDELAQAEQIRNQKAKHEIEDLRQELYESRRRRLKIIQPGKKTE
jgi:hypothetical protein